MSLTSMFRKRFEKSIYYGLQTSDPQLNTAHWSFRECQNLLDQVLCLTEICKILLQYHYFIPTLAFLGIKSSYGIMGRRFIWNQLQSFVSRNHIDVHIEVLLNSSTSSRFKPTTGVLQGFVSLLLFFLLDLYQWFAKTSTSTTACPK